ncbi:MAG: hypothetical protein ACRCVN_07340 [Spirochaetia bacterium]
MKFYLRLMLFFLLFALGFVVFLGFRSYFLPVILGYQQRYVAINQSGLELNAEKLEVLQVSHQYVFPYDFMKKPYPENWAILLLKNPTHYQMPADEFNIKFYKELKNIGIDLVKQPESFLLLKAEAQMGFILEKAKFEVTSSTELNQPKNLNVTLGRPSILAIDLKISPSPEGWASMLMQPSHWALLSDFLENRIEKNLLHEENFELMKRNVESLVSDLFITQEFQNINFVYKEI